MEHFHQDLNALHKVLLNTTKVSRKIVHICITQWASLTSIREKAKELKIRKELKLQSNKMIKLLWNLSHEHPDGLALHILADKDILLSSNELL